MRIGAGLTRVQDTTQSDAGATRWARNGKCVVFHFAKYATETRLMLFNFEQWTSKANGGEPENPQNGITSVSFEGVEVRIRHP